MLREGRNYRPSGFDDNEIRFRMQVDEMHLVEEITEILYNEGVLPEASPNLLGRFALAKFLDEFQRMEAISLENLRQGRFQRRRQI